MDEFEKNYNRALRFLSFRVRSEKEIRDYFQKKKVEQSVAEKIVEKLKQYKFLNDEEFARIWIEQRIKIKPRALRIIQFELKQKGVNEEIINSQFSILDSSFDGQFTNERMAQELIRRKVERYKDLPKQELRQKLGRFLAGKGFSWDTIKKAIEFAVSDKK